MRKGILSLALIMLTGCVSSGAGTDPLKSEQGRAEARDAYIQLAIGYLQEGQPSRAKAPISEALKLDSRNAQAHMVLALIFQQEMEYDLADEEFRKAISLSNDSRIQNNYGSFLFERERYAEAQKYFELASQDTLYPERARVFQNLGLVALKLQQPQQAEAFFTRALRLDGTQTLALLHLAKLNYERQEIVPASQYFQAYTQLAQPTAEGLLLGAQLAEAVGDRSNAASLVLQLKRLYPASAEYQQWLTEHP